MSGYAPVGTTADDEQRKASPQQSATTLQGGSYPPPPPIQGSYSQQQPSFTPQGQYQYPGPPPQQPQGTYYSSVPSSQPQQPYGSPYATPQNLSSYPSNTTLNPGYAASIAPSMASSSGTYFQQQDQQQLSSPNLGASRPMARTPFQRMPTRRMVQTEVVLDDGNFVVEIPSSKKMLEGLPHQEGEEFTNLRYTACTAEPQDFPQRYTLRQKKFGRRTKMAVVVTMYNEDDVLLCKSLTAIMKNISYLCTGRVAGWTKDSWKDIVVVIVSDGRFKCNPLALKALAVLGCYTEGLCKASVNGDPVTAHIFEYTTQFAIRRDLTIRKPRDEAKDGLTLAPCQIIFLLKEKNAKKINSHRWFFKAVCDQLDPEICILIDVGTKPSKESFFHLYNAFDRDPRVAGACGEIVTELGPKWNKLINPIIAIQNFEYKMSNILDKPLESVFGYISVLPGAFSAYRYKALQGKPLECYFKGENPVDSTLQEANMYLAEDRILCFELCVKSDAEYLLRYVKSAKAETDVPSTLEALMLQRRRWINGSFFASVYATYNWKRIFSSGHNAKRKAILFAEFFIFNIASDQASAACTGGAYDLSADPFNGKGPVVFEIVKAIYTFTVAMVFIASLGNRPAGSKVLFITASVIFAILTVLMLFMSIFTIKVSVDAYNSTNPHGLGSFIHYSRETPAFRDLVVSILSTYGLFLMSSLLHLEPWHIITCMVQYVLMIPTFINILTIIDLPSILPSVCNLHDVSWGTKGLDVEPKLAPVVVTKAKDGSAMAVVELPATADSDVDAEWEALRKEVDKERANLKDRSGPDDKPNAQTAREDLFKQLRTNTLLLWLFTNGLLVYIFTDPFIIKAMFPRTTANAAMSKQAVNPYLTFLFWTVAFLSLFRFIFSTVYLVGWSFEGMETAGKRNPFRSAARIVKEEVSTDRPA
ncbi:Chitin synthase, class 2 [Phlyctochytrium planicorne]|nr:Chitin synthase, class 2 [Phlyctochytrium planicorne]